ncbi:16S rRNA (uracil(1498)-N(3))-methyltransferase [Cytophaga aurantiaca]|uniref:16S rRNA (uracil(1498)-N(3))-methyltransferase n=1 Tax=Cytophaga aurantiaca TaxID=29530 RepID=UPI00036C92D9|nr:16S rRNA (uracil(1498)-N(3))-methyltransferase [Cytophaga aurantiaca]
MSHLFLNKDVYSCILDEQESVHVVKVLRLKEGDAITVTNGNGIIVSAQITKADHRKCGYKIIEEQKIDKRSAARIHIAISPTKNIERMEWLVEKCTEFGIDAFSFVLTEHSERKNLAVTKLEKTSFAAIKQSGQPFLPVFSELIAFNNFLKQDFSAYEYKLIACLDEDIKPTIMQLVPANKSCIVLIGPEGDFTGSEVQQAVEKGFVKISLGNSILRTETAAIASCHILNLIQEK